MRVNTTYETALCLHTGQQYSATEWHKATDIGRVLALAPQLTTLDTRLLLLFNLSAVLQRGTLSVSK